MNAQQLINKIERIEVDGSYAPDFQSVARDERFSLLAALRSGDGAKIKAAQAEATRVLEMWGAL